MRITAEQARDFEARGLIAPQPKRKPAHTHGVMNGVEREWAEALNDRLASGKIRGWKFEAVKLVVAPAMSGGKRMTFTPDFLVWELDGTLSLEETKGGFIRDDAAAKLRLVPRIFPEFRFRLCQKVRGVWRVEEVRA